jgi:hypothetical protein
MVIVQQAAEVLPLPYPAGILRVTRLWVDETIGQALVMGSV